MYRLLLLPLLFVFACQSDEDDPVAESFDRQAMLVHWADNIILPALQDFRTASADLQASIDRLATSADLPAVRADFAAAYLSWQRLSPFMVGPGNELRLRAQVNTFPTDTERLLEGVRTDLSLPTNTDVQGLPAIEFLLYGTADPLAHTGKLRQLSDRIVDLATAAETAWTFGYRDAYVASTGNSATSSIDRTVNEYIQWYERNLRAGKVGLPAGVFSDRPLPELAEARYHGSLSKPLFHEALRTAESFFTTTPGLATYLDALEVQRDGEALSSRIEAGLADARRQATDLNEDFATQVTTDNTALLQLYDALQRNVVLLKVDMLQALSINVDYVDADGD